MLCGLFATGVRIKKSVGNRSITLLVIERNNPRYYSVYKLQTKLSEFVGPITRIHFDM